MGPITLDASAGADGRRFTTRWLAVSGLLIVVAAVCSDGFHHPDEHFQTLEFAGTKLGRNEVAELPWEHSSRMRGWLQPGLYVLEARAWSALGVAEPFTWALGFRLTSGLLAWLALRGLVRHGVPRWFPDHESRRVAVRALCATWFVPYLAVRTSSESLSGSCLALAIATLMRARTADDEARRAAPLLLLSGFLLGLAFELRYAVAVAVAGVLAWAFAIARLPLRRMPWLGAGIALAVALAAWADRWGYNTWTFPPYQYFFRNLVEGRAAARFGESPWYGFILLAANGPAGVLILVSLAGSLLAWLRKPLHLLTWTTAPFVLVHSLIAHKELRFLFPVAMLAPILLVLATAPTGDGWDRRLQALWAQRRRPLGRIVVGLNLVALTGFCLTPTRPQIGFQRFVRRHYPASFEAYVLRTPSPWVANDLQMGFYRPDELRLHPIGELADAERHGRPHFLLVTASCVPPVATTYTCDALYRSLPCALRALGGERMDRIPAWDLYRCVAPPDEGGTGARPAPPEGL